MTIVDTKTPNQSSDLANAISVAEFCKRFSIGRSTAYEERKRGKLVMRKIGNRTIILRADAERWAASLPEVGHDC